MSTSKSAGEIRPSSGQRGGQSTFFNCLTGVLRPSSGRILSTARTSPASPNRNLAKASPASYQSTNPANATTLENVRIAARRPPLEHA